MLNMFEEIKKSKKVFIIAEAGVNHNGNIDIAKKLVDAAFEAGVDAVKFQTFKTEKIVGKYAKMAQYQIENTGTSESQFDMIKKLELKYSEFKDIKEYCENKGILFLSTPDDEDSLEFLCECDVPMIKIGSTEVTNLQFLKRIGEKMKPLILSTGMSTLGEVEKAIETIKNAGNDNIILLHCVSDYPASYEDVNLNAMITMKGAFKLPVGYSDHTLGAEASIAAVALGAVVIEKHFTIDNDLDGPDHKASLNPDQLKCYVESIRKTEKLLGDGIKRPTEKEKETIKVVRRSIVAKKDINEGTILTKEMFEFKRPGDGIKPELIDMICNRVLRRDLKEDEPLKWEDI